MSESVNRERGRFMLQLVFDQEVVGRLLDRFPALLAAFLFDDLAVTLLQSLALAALLPYGLIPVRRAGGASVPPPPG